MIKIALNEAEIPFGENNIATVTVHDTVICVARFGSELFAFRQKCPHAGVLLNEGWIDAQGNVVCPLHEYKFSLKTGRQTAQGEYLMKRWKVAVKEDGIYLDTSFI